MTSFIIASKNKKKRQEYAAMYCKKLDIQNIDITVIEKDETGKSQSIGIENIKIMQKKLFLKPIQSKTKAVIIEDAQDLTIEAQNALLKVLEEPPENTIIFLSSETKDIFLPTILSRCQIIEIEQENKELTEKDHNEILEFLQNLSEMPIGDKLKKAEQLAKDKDKAILWIEKVIFVLREMMLKKAENNKEQASHISKTLKSFTRLRTLLKTTNVNARFAIEHTFVILN